MSADGYKDRLRHAAWTWREAKVSRFHKPPLQKDRVMGRHDKRAARADQERETAAEVAAIEPPMWDESELDYGPTDLWYIGQD